MHCNGSNNYKKESYVRKLTPAETKGTGALYKVLDSKKKFGRLTQRTEIINSRSTQPHKWNADQTTTYHCPNCPHDNEKQPEKSPQLQKSGSPWTNSGETPPTVPNKPREKDRINPNETMHPTTKPSNCELQPFTATLRLNKQDHMLFQLFDSEAIAIHKTLSKNELQPIIKVHPSVFLEEYIALEFKVHITNVQIDGVSSPTSETRIFSRFELFWRNAYGITNNGQSSAWNVFLSKDTATLYPKNNLDHLPGLTLQLKPTDGTFKFGVFALKSRQNVLIGPFQQAMVPTVAKTENKTWTGTMRTTSAL